MRFAIAKASGLHSGIGRLPVADRIGNGCLEVVGADAQRIYRVGGKELVDRLIDFVQSRALQVSLEVEHRARRRDKEVAGQQNALQNLAGRPLEPDEGIDGAAGSGVCATQRLSVGRRIVDFGDKVVAAYFLFEVPTRQRLLGVADGALGGPDPQALLESLHERAMDRGDVGQLIAEQFL